MDWTLVVALLASVAVAINGQVASQSDCDLALTGGVPSIFDDAPGSPGTNLAVFDVRLCDTSGGGVCTSVDNRALATTTSTYRIGEDYLIYFNSAMGPYTSFIVSETFGGIENSNSYTNRVLYGAPTLGMCYAHELTPGNNGTFLVWSTNQPAGTVTFRALAKYGGTDVFLSKTLTFEAQDCTGSSGNIESCAAFYAGDTCFADCDPGYETSPDVETTCQSGGAYSPAVCTQKIPNFCDQADGFILKFSQCASNEIDDTCTNYCNSPLYIPLTGTIECNANGDWVPQAGGIAPACEYDGNCPLDLLLEQPNVRPPNGGDPAPCGDFDTGQTCDYTCDVGYDPVDGTLTCTGGGWDNDEPECAVIPNFCKIEDIVGPFVTPGNCLDDDVASGLTCNYDCNETARTPKSSLLRCDGSTSIGWSFDQFECETPAPTLSPVPTPEPTRGPPPTSPTVPTAPTPPTVFVPPTFNPAVTGPPTVDPGSATPIFVILGAGGGVALLSVAACVGYAYRRGGGAAAGVPLGVPVDQKGGYQTGPPGQGASRFAPIEKQKYNAFDNW